MIFVDSNIPMYLVGAPHPNKTQAKLMLERAITDGERLVTDAEVLQEILHRYVAIKRREAIEPAMHAILGVVDEVFPIGHRDVLLAQRILEDDEKLDARDAIHVAVIRRQRVSRVMTFDKRLEAAAG
ncbi:MAG: type II toxin-antitoxin system VapC family toxin [Gemmatimonadetes bacterium]|nr:type II toxin-antitoxin system VapC family toxin [Gemmatimonadota bacterium]